MCRCARSSHLGVGVVGIEPVDLTDELVLYWANGDPEDALTALEHVDDLRGAVSGVDGDSVGKQRHVGERGLRSKLNAQDFHSLADLFQRHTSV